MNQPIFIKQERKTRDIAFIISGLALIIGNTLSFLA